MTRIVENLLVGTVEDIPFSEQMGYSILGACKYPLHRQHARLQGATEEGYLTKAMPKDEPEYLWAERDHAIYLNLIDAKDMKYIPDEVINKALEFIDKELEQGKNVLIVCNKAESRSPSIALMFLIKNGYFESFEDSRNGFYHLITWFQNNIYPNYNPSNGMKEYVNKFWNEHIKITL